ncbi:MAG: glycosyltransferase family 4 protein [Melioribacteraceae bacterium]
MNRVLFVDNDSKSFGPTISMNYILSELNNQGFEITLLTPKTESLTQEYSEAGIRVIHLQKELYLSLHFTNIFKFYTLKGLFFYLQTILRFVTGTIYATKIIRDVKPNLVYVNEYVFVQFAIAAKILNIPAVTHIRSPFIKGSFGVRRKILSRILLMSNLKIFAITNCEAEQISSFHYDKKKIIVIREFLNTDNFLTNSDTEKIKCEFAIPPNEKVLLMLGGVDQTKGTATLIESFALLKKNFKNVQLIVAGHQTKTRTNEQYWKLCQNIILKNNLTESVKIIPFCTRVVELIAIADVIISSSISSHFSRPMIEAWAQKKPVVISQTRHALEFAVHGINAMTYPANDSLGLYEQLKLILTDTELREQISLGGYRTAQKYFNSNNNISLLIKVIKSIVEV